MSEDILYKFITNYFSAKARGTLAMYLAHDMELAGVTEILLDRKDYKEKGELLAINRKGELRRLQRTMLNKSYKDTIAVDKQHYRDLRREVRELRAKLNEKTFL